MFLGLHFWASGVKGVEDLNFTCEDILMYALLGDVDLVRLIHRGGSGEFADGS